jgi:hypothetical protein
LGKTALVLPESDRSLSIPGGRLGSVPFAFFGFFVFVNLGGFNPGKCMSALALGDIKLKRGKVMSRYFSDLPSLGFDLQKTLFLKISNPGASFPRDR